MRPTVPIRALALAAALGLAGCSSAEMEASAKGGEGQPAPSFSQFSDVPVPEGAHMDVDRTLLLGQGENWVGRLVLNVRWNGSAALWDFYKSQMPKYGWQEIASVRATTSVMTWQRGSRVATIQIDDTTLGAEAMLTMTPAGGTASTGVPAPPAPEPPAPAAGNPEPPVSTEQLK